MSYRFKMTLLERTPDVGWADLLIELDGFELELDVETGNGEYGTAKVRLELDTDVRPVAVYDHTLWNSSSLNLAITEGERCQKKRDCARCSGHKGVCVAAPPLHLYNGGHGP